MTGHTSWDKVRQMRPHRVIYDIDPSDGVPAYAIECPYEDYELDRPCVIWDCDCWADEPRGEHREGCPRHSLEGCAVEEYLDAGGYEAIRIEGEGFRVVVPVTVTWDEDGPILRRP